MTLVCVDVKEATKLDTAPVSTAETHSMEGKEIKSLKGHKKSDIISINNDFSCVTNFISNFRSWDSRTSPNFNPQVSCSGHKECLRIDMNSICSETTSRCECREDMKWNNETLECQVFEIFWFF